MRKRVPQQPASLSFQPASTKERVLLENLAQFYSYDFSEVLEMYVDQDGRFALVPAIALFHDVHPVAPMVSWETAPLRWRSPNAFVSRSEVPPLRRSSDASHR